MLPSQVRMDINGARKNNIRALEGVEECECEEHEGHYHELVKATAAQTSAILALTVLLLAWYEERTE